MNRFLLLEPDCTGQTAWVPSKREKVNIFLIETVFLPFSEKLLFGQSAARQCVLPERDKMVYKDELERIRRELIERRDDLQRELGNLPEGVLLCTGDEKKRKYYQRLPAKGNRKKERRFGVKKNPVMLRGLVRKEYVTSALEVLDRDIKMLDAAIRKYRPADENSVMQGFLNEYPELAGCMYSAYAGLDEWKNAFHTADDYHPESFNAITIAGESKRSKNEIYIASRLDHYGLVYRHDCPTGIPGLYRNPDFQIIRPRDLKLIYWEHFGMMDDLEYRIDYKRKMEEYEEHGIVPWDNLITTFGNARQLDAKMIEATIQGWLL